MTERMPTKDEAEVLLLLAERRATGLSWQRRDAAAESCFALGWITSGLDFGDASRLNVAGREALKRAKEAGIV